MSALSDAAFGYLPEYVREADDGTLAALLESVCSQADVIVDWLANPTTDVDPLTAPANRVPWIAAIAGVDISGVPATEQRAFIADDVTRYRGNLSALRKRVGLTLTGGKSIEITSPYSGDANQIAITTFASETPSSSATTAAIRAELPAWLKATITTNAAGQSYSNLAADYSTYGAMTTTGKSYGTLALET